MLVSVTVLSGCVSGMSDWTTVTQDSQRVRYGDSEATVMAIMGEPNQSEINGQYRVMKYCSSAMFDDAFSYILLKSGKVIAVQNAQGRVGGLCYEFFRSVNWIDTESSEKLALNEIITTTPRNNSGNFSGLAEGLQNSMQQNNQMYNSLIESMGTQQQSLQPQRFQTNCIMIGNMMSCN